jgi:serine/threonine protein kinase
MGDQDTERTIIFDLVQLERLGAEFERRFRGNPAIKPQDVLVDIAPEDHALYLPQLTKLHADLNHRRDAGMLDPLGDLEAAAETIDAGDYLHRSLVASALADGLVDVKPSSTGDPRSSGDRASRDKDKASADANASSGTESKIERIDQFRILRELGAGAFGVVYLAEDESLQRKVAIKVPKVSDPARSASYINEARKAAAIDCKGIVPIYHVGTKENGDPFVVQKLIDGPTLRFLLSRYGSLPPAHAVTLMRDVAVALSSAHRLGIYHRDLKPDNVLIDGSGVPWIADFGLAISESEQAQRKGEIAGTLIYMSPEQIQGRADWLDGRSDIWALGIMLYELLLGKPPFGGKNRQSLMEQICHREPRPLQQSSASLSTLNEVFKKCCAKNASDRYASVDELAFDLNLLIEQGLPTQTIDGSELRFEQPISQYPSTDSQGTRIRTAIGANSTLPGSRAGSAQEGTMDSLRRSSGQHGSGSANEMAQAATEVLPTEAVQPKGGHRVRVAMIGMGLLSVTLFGAQQWISRNNATGLAQVVPSDNDNDKGKGSGDDEQGGDAGNSAGSDSHQGEGKKDDVAATPLNALTLEQANGTKELPWVVAVDGSGSHRTIAEAISASAPNAFVQVKPGMYVESLKISNAVTLIGSGEPDECVIFNDQGPPLEIEGGLGQVRVSGFSIRGDGRPNKKEFNAIDLVSGALTIEDCNVRSGTWNAIKLRPGTSLTATRCTFSESSYFAISGKSHRELKISDCEFRESGIQMVEGTGEIRGCQFNGSEGIYVEANSENPASITDCTFSNCFKYGVESTILGNVLVNECNFEACKIGVQTNQGDAILTRCDFRKCSAAINVVGGKMVVKDQTRISDGEFGVTMEGGNLEMVDSSLNNLSSSGIIALDCELISLKDTKIADCRVRGMTVNGGNLRVEGGSIQACQDSGIYVGDLFVRGEVIGTEFTSNLGAAIIQESGRLDCTDLSITDSEIGFLIRSAEEEPTKTSLTRVRFSKIESVFADLDGPAIMVVREPLFGDVPEDKRFRKLGGATVTVQ